MRRAAFGLALAAVMLLSGCGIRDIEEQAYAVSMGVDLAGERICVSVQVPALNQEGGGSGGENGGGKQGYSFAEASGDSLTEALEMLHATLPRALNLTGVKSIVVSEELAGRQRFADVMHEMALSYRVFGAAELVICRGRASDFIKSQQADIGLRLSESTTVALEHYHEIGCVPSVRAADAYYMSRSVYGDAAVALAAVNADKMTGSDEYAGDMARSGDHKDLYFGSALLKRGVMVGVLTGEKTQMLNLLLGNLKSFGWTVQGVPVRVLVTGGPDVTVDLTGGAPLIDVALTVDIMDAEQKADGEALRERMLSLMEEMTGYCQRLNVDPFRYAERAAGQFLTLDEWLRYDWRERFGEAEVRYNVRVRRAEY